MNFLVENICGILCSRGRQFFFEELNRKNLRLGRRDNKLEGIYMGNSTQEAYKKRQKKKNEN